jgi:hypothetical protein
VLNTGQSTIGDVAGAKVGKITLNVPKKSPAKNKVGDLLPFRSSRAGTGSAWCWSAIGSSVGLGNSIPPSTLAFRVSARHLQRSHSAVVAALHGEVTKS